MEMRRKDRLITHEEVMEALSGAEYGVLSSVDADGIPYGIPVNFAVIDGGIFFHCTNEGGHKLNNIRANSNVCFTVVDSVKLMPERFSTKYRSVVAFGKAEILESEEEKKAALKALLEKLAPDFMESGIKYINASVGETAIVKITVDQITGKANKG